MQTYIITPTNAIEQQKLAQFLEESRLPSKVLTDQEKEDLGMLMLMSEVDVNDTVSEDEVRKILSS